jgi:ABC-type antimicrobial peptide transport system permease subunit
MLLRQAGRGSITLPRMNAHRMVVIAAALTVLVAAMLASGLTVLDGQALPFATYHDLAAGNTTLTISGAVNGTDDAQYASALPGELRSALDGTPFTLYHARWSDPLGFTGSEGPSARASAGNVPIAEAATLDDVEAHAVLVTGAWPTAPTPGLIPAALPTTAAALLHLARGDTLTMRDRASGSRVRFLITGLYRPVASAGTVGRYWQLDTLPLSGASSGGGFTTYGPLTVQPSAFARDIAVGAASWVAEPDTALMRQNQFSGIASQVNQLGQTLADSPSLPSLLLTSSLPSVLTGLASNLDVARSLLAMSTIILALLAASALLAVARLLAGQRDGETAMLAARGATRWQLIRLAAAEAIPLCLVTAVAGAAAGMWLARLLVPGTSARLSGGVIEAALVVAVGSLLIMLGPTLSRLTPGAARVRRGRQAAVSTASRAGADVALIVLAALTCWQLRHYSATSAGASGTFGVDPVVVAAPALALAAGTVTALRLLPIGGRAGDRLAARGRRLVAALASWQISRQPIRQGGAALLIVLAVATATLALSQRHSWTRSDDDQAAFTAGADVRVQTLQPLTPAQAGALVRTPGVQYAMPAADFPYAVQDSDVLAIDTASAADVTLLRADQTPVPERSLFNMIRTGPAPGTGAGITVPGQPRTLTVTARLGPASLGLGPVDVTVTVEDADDDVYQLPSGPLPDDGQTHTLTVPVTGRDAIYPLRIIGVSVAYTLPVSQPRSDAQLTIGDISGVPGQQLNPFAASNTSTQIGGALDGFGMVGSYAQPGTPARSAGPGGAQVFTFGTGYGIAANGPSAPDSPVGGELTLTSSTGVYVIPGIATQSFLAANGAKVGSTVQATLDGQQIGVQVVAAVPAYPTASADGTLIVDLAAVQDMLTAEAQTSAPVLQWWLATRGGQLPPGLAASLPAGSVITSRNAIAQGLLTDPLSEVPQQALLGLAVAALLLASTGFCVSIAAGVQQRRAENALLAALGVAPRAAAGQLCLEKFMLSLPSALAGLALGAVLAELIVPAITLSATASTPQPPVLIEFGWVPTLAAAVLLAILPVVVAALVMVQRPDPAAALRAAETV